jgi:hypothetical protein
MDYDITQTQNHERKRKKKGKSDLPLDPNGKWGRKEVRELSLSELEDLQEEVARVADDIEIQVERAKAEANMHGEYSDPDWFWSAQAALKAFRRKRQIIQEVKSDLRYEAKQTFDVNKLKRKEYWFKQICKEEMNEERWEDICKRASKKAEEEGYTEENHPSNSHPLIN